MINYPAIHQAYQEHKQHSLGGSAQSQVPQPEGNTGMHKMIMHAMAMTPSQDGETHGTMIIRALTEHLKRVTPDISSIHKQPKPASNGQITAGR